MSEKQFKEAKRGLALSQKIRDSLTRPQMAPPQETQPEQESEMDAETDSAAEPEATESNGTN